MKTEETMTAPVDAVVSAVSLDWTRESGWGNGSNISIMWIAETGLGAFYVMKKNGRWFWYYGPERFSECKDSESGKRAALDDFKRRLVEILRSR